MYDTSYKRDYKHNHFHKHCQSELRLAGCQLTVFLYSQQQKKKIGINYGAPNMFFQPLTNIEVFLITQSTDINHGKLLKYMDHSWSTNEEDKGKP